MDLFEQDHFGGGGPAGLFAHLTQGFGGMAARRMGRPNPRAYDEYFKAYSVAMLPGRPRDNVSYGGKIIMPPSVLANLTNMELESPWMFKLRNPANPAASTHAGVLEFIAEEGCAYLPRWMMQTLRLEEGDPIRITGCELSKGKLVKLQAQNVDFLEISDPKAVLEQALRNFSALTQGDIIEISYNSIVFGLLVMETQPGGEGISVLDTDLEVDFAAPVGYVEPERPKAAPQPTMRDKLNIDLSSSTPGSSRPSSSLGLTGKGPAISKGGDQWESFKGKGETLQGRKTKGKGISHRKAEAAPDGSKIIRTDKQRIVTAEALDNETYVPAPLNLPFGQLFFGFNIQPYVPPSQEPPTSPQDQSNSFTGAGNTLTGRSQQASDKGQSKAHSSSMSNWGSGGQTLGARARSTQPTNFTPRPVGAGGASVPVLPPRGRTQQQPQRPRSPSPEDYGVDDDEDIVYYSDD